MRRLFFAAALLVSVSVFSAEYKNFKEAMKDVNEKVKAKDYSAARSAAGDAEKMAQKTGDFVDVKMILARIAVNENDFASARKLYQEALALPEIDGKQKFNILSQVADTYSKENNIAEYKALMLGLKGALANGFHCLDVYLDSELLANQINGSYKVKNPNLKILMDEVRSLLKSFQSVSVKHVRRCHNADADRLANRAIDEYKG